MIKWLFIKAIVKWLFLVSSGALVVIIPLAFAPEIYELCGERRDILFPVIIIYSAVWGFIVIKKGYDMMWKKHED